MALKRLVGEPGDVLEIKVPDEIFTNGTDVRKGVPGILYRNGYPIEGKTAFLENRRTTESLAKDPNSEIVTGYPGYRTDGLLSNRKSLKVPNKIHPDNPTGKKAFFAMGDNSTDSLDGRSWGFVPENEMIGRALLYIILLPRDGDYQNSFAQYVLCLIMAFRYLCLDGWVIVLPEFFYTFFSSE